MQSGTDLAPEALLRRLRGWLVARVLIVTVFLGAVAVSHVSSASNPDFPRNALFVLIAVAYAFSAASAYGAPRIGNLRAFALVQVVFDVVLNSVAVLLTGALTSPMGVWYNLAIIGAAFLLLRRGAYTAATLSSLTYGTLMDVVYYHALPSSLGFALPAPQPGLGVVFNIAVNIASFFSIAFLSSILVDRLVVAQRELRESQEDLQRIESLQKALVQNLESGVVTTDAEGLIESANQAIDMIVGRPGAELIGKPISDVFPVLRPPVGPNRVIDASPMPIELSRRSRPEADEQILRVTRAPFTDTYGNVIGALFILQDVTQLKKLAAESLEEQLASDDQRPRPKVPEIVGFLGRSPRMIEIIELIHKIAPAESTVLITGESGTGKELVARAIHSLGPRREKPLVVVNCAAIPADLIESELFGHVRGAFTGAIADRRGLFRSADGGTIFLDEVGDLPLALQVKLLRVLQERSFTPVGAQSQAAVDVRIIAATNRDLEAEISRGNFREDLFYRLNVIRIHMPPLRERTDDLPMLINHFLNQFADVLHKPVCKVSSGAMKRLLNHSYPGNIRELENIIEHSVALAENESIREEDLPFDLARNGVKPASGSQLISPNSEDQPARIQWMEAGSSNLDAELEAIEKQLLEEALRRAGGVRKRAAEILGINYRSLRHRLSKYGFGEVDSQEARG